MSDLAGGFRAGRPAIRTYTTGVQRDFYTHGIGARDEVMDLTQFQSRLYNIWRYAHHYHSNRILRGIESGDLPLVSIINY